MKHNIKILYRFLYWNQIYYKNEEYVKILIVNNKYTIVWDDIEITSSIINELKNSNAFYNTLQDLLNIFPRDETSRNYIKQQINRIDFERELKNCL